MEFTVKLAVKGRAYVTVEATDFDEAKEKACEEGCELDFGPLENIEWEAVNAEREDGQCKDY